MGLSGIFTSSTKDVLFTSWNALQTAHEVLQTWISFFDSIPDLLLFSHPLLSFVNSFTDMTWVRVSGCAAMCTFKKCATTQYLDSRKEVCTSSGFVLLTRLEWDVPPRPLIPSVQRTLWNTPEQQVNGEPVRNSRNYFNTHFFPIFLYSSTSPIFSLKFLSVAIVYVQYR